MLIPVTLQLKVCNEIFSVLIPVTLQYENDTQTDRPRQHPLLPRTAPFWILTNTPPFSDSVYTPLSHTPHQTLSTIMIDVHTLPTIHFFFT